MFVAKVVDGQIVDSGDLAFMFANTSFPASGPDAAWMQENNIKVVQNWVAHDVATQRLSATAPYLSGDDVLGVEAVSLSEEEISGNLAAAASRMRSARDQRLAESDWTQLADSPLSAEDKAAWAAYRQSLRDITQQEGFPAVDLPLRPGETPMLMGA